MLVAAAEPPITIFAVSIGSLLVSILFLGKGLRWLNESLERGRGPSVLGRIISSQVVDRPTRSVDGPDKTWRLDVAYEYSVGGREFVGTRISPGAPWFNSWLYATWQARKYELGASVRVYFDPTAPDRAILDPRLTVWSPWIFLLIGIVCAVVGTSGLTGIGGIWGE
jgi:hypothetical protein